MKLSASLLIGAFAVAPAAHAAGASHTVTIEGMKFTPERLEVSAGDSVTWVNKDFLPHSVTAKAAGIESGDLAPGKRWKLVAKRKGEIDYICRLHPVMHGMLIVK